MDSSYEIDHSINTVDGVVKEVGNMAMDTLLKLDNTWKEIYECDDNWKDEKLKLFLEYTQGFFKDLIASQERRKEELILKIESKLKEQESLQKELHLIIDAHVNENEPLSSVLTKLEESLKDYRKIKEERVAKLAKLEHEEKKLCHLLEVDNFKSLCRVPSQSDLEEKEHKIFELLQEKCDREQAVSEAKSRIAKYFAILEKEPKLKFEKEMIDGTIKITASNMTKLKDWELCLNEEIRNATEHKMSLLERLNKLWDRIKVDTKYREQFLGINSGVGKTTIDNICSELDRCEEIKLANLKPMIISAKQELEELWEKCNYGESQKSLFPAYMAETYNEEVLQLYEIEIELIRQHYKTNAKLYHLSSIWEGLWERMVQLETLATDKSRLFNNRGGQLLKEEKERKTLEKKLPKVYLDLTTLLEEYAEKNGKRFLWKGRDLLEQINSDWESRLENQNKATPSYITRSAQKPALKRDLHSALSSSMESLYNAGTKSPYSTLSCGSSKSCLTLNKQEMKTPIAQRKKWVDCNTPKTTPLKRQCPTNYNTPAKRLCKTPISSTPNATPTPIRQIRKPTPIKALPTPKSGRVLRNRNTPTAPNPGCTPKTIKFNPAKPSFNFNI